jgi:hypothetical protein
VRSTLRARFGLLALVGIFLIPLLLTALRGLTHVLTCERQVQTPFAFRVQPGAEPVLLSTGVIRRGEPETLCGGLLVQLSARSEAEDRIAVTVPITNGSPHPWNGTVLLRLGDTSLPVGVGSIRPGETQADTLVFRLDPGLHEVTGSLLIGP